MKRAVPSALRQWWQRVGGGVADTMHPVLSGEQIRSIAARATGAPVWQFGGARTTTHRLIGEQPSRSRGRGYEFEEHRRYQQGDDPRLINWRLYARTGETYTRVYNEERRADVVIVVDRRASMRFATQGELKLVRAVQIAAGLFYQARRQALAVGGMTVDSALHRFDARSGEAPEHPWFVAMNAPCPPLGFGVSQPSTEQVLRALVSEPGSGNHVVLLSDFADLDPASAQPLLAELAARHAVTAIRITDPVEAALPAGTYLLDDPASSEPLNLDGRDKDLATQFRYAMRERLEATEKCFAACGIALQECRTTDDAFACMEQARA